MSLDPQRFEYGKEQKGAFQQAVREFLDLESLTKKLRGSDKSCSQDEERFLDRWLAGRGKDGFFPSSRECLIRNVHRAASYYPTGDLGDLKSSAVLLDLTSSTKFSTEILNFSRMPGRAFEFHSLSFDLEKRKLYRDASIKAPYLPKGEQASYLDKFGAKLALHDACPLCSHIAQGFDLEMSQGIELSPLLARSSDYALIPNRFPPSPGPFDLLLLRLSHDDAERQTQGRIISKRELEVVREVCSTLGMVAHHNHVRDGMTVPEHDHWKLTPLEFPAGQWLELSKYALAQAGAEAVWEGPLRGTPFDTLAVTGQDPRLVNDRVASLLHSLESNGEVYTLWYAQGVFAILPRWNSAVSRGAHSAPISTNAGSHLIIEGETDFLRRVQQRVPLIGEFGWERYTLKDPQSRLEVQTLSEESLPRASQVEVLWRNEVPPSLVGRTAVVIDVAAATTNIADIVAAGAELYLTSTTRVLHDLATLKEAGKNPMLIGETLDPALKGELSFYCSNDPRSIRESGILNNSKGQTILYMSNNGTRVVVDALARGASRVLAASFVNVSAIAESLRGHGSDSVILPAGEIQFAQEYREGEDFECAQFVAQKIRGHQPDPARYCDSARNYVLREYRQLHPVERQESFVEDFTEILNIVVAVDRNPVVPECQKDPGNGLIKVINSL